MADYRNSEPASGHKSVTESRPPQPLEDIKRNSTRGILVGMTIFWMVALGTAIEPTWNILVLIPSAVVSFVLAAQWEHPSPRLLQWALFLGVVTALVGGVYNVSPLSTGGLLIAGAVFVPTLSRARLLGSTVLVGIAVGYSLLSALNEPDQMLLHALMALVFGIFWISIFWGARSTMRVMIEREKAYQAQTQVALYKEKFRFAADLHDIQGHTLHVIKMKAALAQRLLRDEPLAADEELDEIRGLLTDTIAQAKSLAYGDRYLTLQGELENAKNLLEAAGATVSVRHSSHMLPNNYEELASLVLRETTTNILRHSQAKEVRVFLDSQRVTIANDGLSDDFTKLRGLEALQRRATEAGASLTASRSGSHFITELKFPVFEKDQLQ